MPADYDINTAEGSIGLGASRGIDGLTVADASIMPTIPPATTNLPTIMVAEHIARWLRSV